MLLSNVLPNAPCCVVLICAHCTDNAYTHTRCEQFCLLWALGLDLNMFGKIDKVNNRLFVPFDIWTYIYRYLRVNNVMARRGEGDGGVVESSTHRWQCVGKWIFFDIFEEWRLKRMHSDTLANNVYAAFAYIPKANRVFPEILHLPFSNDSDMLHGMENPWDRANWPSFLGKVPWWFFVSFVFQSTV